MSLISAQQVTRAGSWVKHSPRKGSVERSVRARSVVNASPAMTNLKGCPTLTSVWKVPKADEAAVDAIWKSHEEWMTKTHTHGTAGTDDERPRLLKFYIAKGKELKDPMNPESGETGMLLYTMSEVYAAPEGIGAHFKVGDSWPDMAKIMEGIGKYGHFIEVGACQVLTAMEDEAKPMITAKGQPTIHAVFKVPAVEEAAFDAMFKSHEEFMRKTHTMNPTGDDSKAPRLSSFFIAKGTELNDPMNPDGGATGNILYVMAETYYAPSGIAGHFAQAELGFKELPQLMGYIPTHGHFFENGACQVFTTFG